MSGYVNLGDCAVLLSAWILGPGLGCAAAGVGSMMADLLGYPLYAPGTLVVKGLMALAAGVLFRCLRREGHVLPGLLASGVVGEAIMVVGYFLYEAGPVPVGLGLGALANVPLQPGAGGLWPALRRCGLSGPLPLPRPGTALRLKRDTCAVSPFCGNGLAAFCVLWGRWAAWSLPPARSGGWVPMKNLRESRESVCFSVAFYGKLV